jgi:hypothetical protein
LIGGQHTFQTDVLRNSLGEHKIYEAMFLFQNDPAIMTPEADEMMVRKGEFNTSRHNWMFYVCSSPISQIC